MPVARYKAGIQIEELQNLTRTLVYFPVEEVSALGLPVSQ